MSAYPFAFAIAGLFGFFLVLGLLSGEIPGQRHRTIRRDRHPNLFWANIGFMTAAALLAGAFGLWGWMQAHGL